LRNAANNGRSAIFAPNSAGRETKHDELQAFTEVACYYVIKLGYKQGHNGFVGRFPSMTSMMHVYVGKLGGKALETSKFGT
jgi:hypothetical protein